MLVLLLEGENAMAYYIIGLHGLEAMAYYLIGLHGFDVWTVIELTHTRLR